MLALLCYIRQASILPKLQLLLSFASHAIVILFIMTGTRAIKLLYLLCFIEAYPTLLRRFFVLFRWSTVYFRAKCSRLNIAMTIITILVFLTIMLIQTTATCFFGHFKQLALQAAQGLTSTGVFHKMYIIFQRHLGLVKFEICNSRLFSESNPRL